MRLIIQVNNQHRDDYRFYDRLGSSSPRFPFGISSLHDTTRSGNHTGGDLAS